MIKRNKIINLCKIALIITKNGPVCIDTLDIPLVEKYHWNIDKCSGYVVTQTGGKKQYLHRLIAQTPPGLQTDHIDGHKNNNRRCNLRAVNASLNQLNRSRANQNSKSQELGVQWRKRNQKWEASLTFQNQWIYIGLYSTKEAAIQARAEKLQELLASDKPKLPEIAELDWRLNRSLERIIDLPDKPLPTLPYPGMEVPPPQIYLNL